MEKIVYYTKKIIKMDYYNNFSKILSAATYLLDIPFIKMYALNNRFHIWSYRMYCRDITELITNKIIQARDRRILFKTRLEKAFNLFSSEIEKRIKDRSVYLQYCDEIKRLINHICSNLSKKWLLKKNAHYAIIYCSQKVLQGRIPAKPHILMTQAELAALFGIDPGHIYWVFKELPLIESFCFRRD